MNHPPYAGFWRRFVASLIDSVLMFIPGFFLGFMIKSVALSFILGAILGILYHVVFETSILMATPGKAFLSVAVVNKNYESITTKQALIRFFAKYLSLLSMFIGYLIQPFTEKRQTLHDILSDVIVIKKEPANDINYFDAWKNQFDKLLSDL